MVFVDSLQIIPVAKIVEVVMVIEGIVVDMEVLADDEKQDVVYNKDFYGNHIVIEGIATNIDISKLLDLEIRSKENSEVQKDNGINSNPKILVSTSNYFLGIKTQVEDQKLSMGIDPDKLSKNI